MILETDWEPPPGCFQGSKYKGSTCPVALGDPRAQLCPPSPGWLDPSLTTRHQPSPRISQLQRLHTWGRLLSQGAERSQNGANWMRESRGENPGTKKKKKLPDERIPAQKENNVPSTESMQQSRFSSHKADRFIQSQNPSGRPRVPCAPSPHEAATGAHICHPRGPQPPSRAHLLSEAAVSALAPFPGRGTAAQRGPTSQAKGSRSVFPAFSSTTTPRQSGGRRLSTHPALTVSLGVGVGVARVGLTHSAPNRANPGTAPEKHLPSHPTSSR